MKIVINTETNDYSTSQQLIIDGKQYSSVHDLSECPEDAIVGRDLIDMEDLYRAIMVGYEAGKRGDVIEVERTEKKSED